MEHYIQQNNGTTAQAKDIYQEAFIAVWQQIKEDKFIPEKNDSLNGYLVKIAKNKWIDYLRSKEYQLKKPIPQGMDIEEEQEKNTEAAQEEELRLQNMTIALSQLETPCREVLTHFYFYKKSLGEIAAYFEIDEASAKNKKYRCMQKLKQILLKKNTKENA